MKKNISINIGGIIFHIEEDGYEKLKSYLSEINSYFKKYGDSSEILSDIEGRIAEIFADRLEKEKQVISLEDVDHLIKTMGTVADFASMEEPEEDYEENNSASNPDARPKKFYRDLKRKIIGGVCSGLANYYKVDPLWSRVIFLILFFGFLIIPPASGFALLLYIVLWIAIPGSNDLVEDTKVKKLYRNPDDKVVAGVASGLAAYFAVDVAIIRLVFVLSFLFFGSGLLIYIILWLIAPQAQTMTEKMQMKGDPVTLGNIENSVKQSLQSTNPERESALVSVLLFPFRLIGKFFEILGMALGPLLEVLGKLIRIAFGLFLMFFSLTGLIAVVIAMAAFLGLLVNPELWMDGFPVEMLTESVPPYLAFAVLLLAGIPFFGIGIFGLRIITMRSMLSNTIAWSIFGVWILSLIIAASTIPGIVKGFSEEGSITQETSYNLDGKTLVLDLNLNGMESYDVANLTIRPHEKEEVLLFSEFKSRGRSESHAIEGAKMISYNVDLVDSILIFDSNIDFSENAEFRAQSLDMTLYIPLGQKFVIKESLDDIIRNTIHYYDYRVSDMGNMFVFENMNDLRCLTCDSKSLDGSYKPSSTEFSKVFDVPGEMTDLTIKGNFKINLRQDSAYLVEVFGRRSKVEEVEFDYNLENKNLEIKIEDYDEEFNFRGRAPVYININTPNIQEIELYGKNELTSRNLELDELYLHMAGFSKAIISGNFKNLKVEFEGLSEAEISGEANYFEATLAGKSDLKAKNLICEEAEIKAYGKSDAVVNVTNYLNAYAAGVSEIKYYGNPKKIDEKTSGISSILKR